jgi:uncharacterized protein (DUF1015 family)
MSIVRPFPAVRPRPELAHHTAAPPYDVLSSDEARKMSHGNPLSFLHINKPEIDLDQSLSPTNPAVYQKGRDNLNEMIESGYLCQDSTPCFYLYRLTMKNRAQTGLVCLTAVEDYDAGIIRKHELTRPDKVKDRCDHILTVGAQVGPVLSTFRSNPEIESILSHVASGIPEYDFVGDNHVRHQLWVISDNAVIETLVELFDKVKSLYIADGHHRSQAASENCRLIKAGNVGHTGNEPYNFFLNVLFSERELHIMPYNRVVRDLNGLSAESLLSSVSSAYTWSKSNNAIAPQTHGEIGLYTQGNWYRLSAKNNGQKNNGTADSLDSAQLTRTILTPQLGIENIRTDKRIEFVGGIRGVEELERLVNSGKFAVAFSLPAVTVSELLAVADAGEFMPPKSTWFEPKLCDGLFVHMTKSL